MIGIEEITTYVPQNFVDNIRQGESFGETENFIRNKVGAIRLPRIKQGEETSDLASKALLKLLEKVHIGPDDIEALTLVTQNGDGNGLPQTSAIVQQKANLPLPSAIFDVSLGCSGYVYGLAILKGFMQASGLKQGVLITADPYSKIIDQKDRTTSLLFGDAATATLIREGAIWGIKPPVYWTDGSGSAHLCVKDRFLEMNGRQIFNFAAMHAPAQIRKILGRESLQEKDIDIFCIHQGSAAIVEAVVKCFPQVRDRFVLDIASTGNTVSSSIPLLLEKYLHRPGIRRILLCGFGVGLSIATTIIEKTEGERHR